MPNLAANLTMLFNELEFIDRFSAAAKSGFRGVEYLHPYAESSADVAEQLQANDLQQVLFNFPPGNWEKGDRGIAGQPDRVTEFRDGVETALVYAAATGCKRLHAMAGCASGRVTQAHLDTYADNLRFVADAAAPMGIDILVEAINSRVDIPGYIIDTNDKVLNAVRAADRPNVRIQFDIYHVQIMHGDLTRQLESLLPNIGHIQLADNPGRHEPGTGEIDYPWLLSRIDELGYDGWVGCEYKPVGETAAGLDWARSYLAN